MLFILLGIVDNVGDNVQHLKIGDNVAVNPNSNCGKCRFCLKGKVNYCLTGGLRSTIGIFSDGCWVEYCEVPGNQILLLLDDVSLVQGVLCEPYSCITRGWDNNGMVDDDAEILVMGGGIIRLLWASLFNHHGYRNVTMTEVHVDRKQIAQSLGFGYKVRSPGEFKEKFSAQEAVVHGFDLIVDCTGHPKAIEEAFPWLRRGGKLNVFGCCPKMSTMQVHPAEFMLREVSVIGTLINPYKFPSAVQLVGAMKDTLKLDKLGIEVFGLCNYENAFAALKDGRISKAVFKIGNDLIC